MRFLHICAAIACAALLGDTWHTPAVAGVAELLFDSRPESLIKGGASVPGPIQAQAEVRYPASLPEAGRGLLRTTTVSDHLLEWRRYGRRVGGSEGSARTRELVLPLDYCRDQPRWYLGLENSDFDSFTDYDRIRPGKQDAFIMDAQSHLRNVGLTYQPSSSLRLAIGQRKQLYDFTGTAWRWRKQPQPPSPMKEFPYALGLDTRSRIFALEHRRGDRLWGLQYTDIDFDSALSVNSKGTDYWIISPGAGASWEIYYRQGNPDECLFMSGRRTKLHAAGPTLTGRMLRGEHTFDFAGTRIQAGRRRFSDSFESQMTFEYTSNRMSLDGFIDSDVLPFPLGERQGLEAWGKMRTVGLRYGGGDQVSARLRLLWGLSLLRSHAELHYVFKQRSDPFGPMEYPHVGFLNFDAISGNIALGLRYSDAETWRITGVASLQFGAADSQTESWEGSRQPPPRVVSAPSPSTRSPEPAAQPSRSGARLQPSYILGLSIERRF